MTRFLRSLPVWLALFCAVAATAAPAPAGLPRRTDINPALVYAQALALMPERAPQDHLFTNEWRGRLLDEQFGTLVASYNPAFRLLRQAARQQAPCDWGYDLSEGPELLLPGLAKFKLLGQVARLRMRWHLENGRPDEARDEFIAAFTMARQVAADGILISTLVQIAIENILESAVAENWFRIPPATLQQMLDGVAAAPPRGTILRCLRTERLAMRDWLDWRIRAIQAAAGNESVAMGEIRALLGHLVNDGADAPASTTSSQVDRILESAAGTTQGLLVRLREMDAFYDEMAVLLALPYDEFRPRISVFNETVAHHPNELLRVFFPSFEKCRLKEFATEVRWTMLQAAGVYRQSGAKGLVRVPDPIGGKPFQFRRIEMMGVDRGFELRSQMTARDMPEALVFLEADGPPFNLDGPNVGKVAK